MKKILLALLAALLAFGVYKFATQKKEFLSVLVFSKTTGYRHESIEAGQQALMAMGKQHGFRVDTTEDAGVFSEKNLAQYNVVVWLNTTGEVLDDAQQLEFNRFIQAGGGFVGIHSAADTEYEWPWYGDLVGAYFKSHPQDPNVREGTIDKVKPHVCTDHLPEHWTRMEEWYNYKDIRSNLDVLLTVDESTYEGGENGPGHPITWCHEFDGGRAFYTGLGHTPESFSEQPFLTLLYQGIEWAAGDKKPVDFNRSTVAPEENRFQKIVLTDNLYEPMELEMLPDGRLIFIERRGNLKIYDPAKDTTEVVNTFQVFSKLEDGLIGMALDPGFADNHWIYFYYSPLNVSHNQISRFTFTGNALDMSSEVKVMEVMTQRDTCCHSGGSLEFGPGGNLFLSTGDNTNPFEADGYGPMDESPGRKYFDAQRTSGNSNDLRGKVLRIHPEPDGSYSIPEGNLFPKDGSAGRPEIYVMGCRNPWRIHIDQHTGYLYWGDVGPDAGKDSVNIGPRGHDEVNMAKTAGNFGWPFFNANNKAYYDRNFASGEVPTKSYDPQHPKNDSPNNTGLKDLPAAQPAYIWYPYAESPEFPLMGTGGRNAMAGPVYYADDYQNKETRFPEYYNKKLFTYDWMRGRIFAVTQKENGDFERMERFLPGMEWDNPTDIIFSPQGDMYILEYGRTWYKQNQDARLIHLKYISGNRPPVAVIDADKTMGAAPLAVQFSAAKSIDYDGDKLSYEWYVNDELQSKEAAPELTFAKAGVYEVRLKTADGQGEVAEVKKEIIAGNDLPVIAWNIPGNRSFFFEKQPLQYDISVRDTEDGTTSAGIDPERVVVSIDYLENGYDVTQIEMGHREAEAASQFALGKELIDKSDCRACHAVDKKVAGPGYQEIAARYQGDATVLPVLAQHIINGSNGIWGDAQMSAHPQLTQNEVTLMVKYILSLSDKAPKEKGLPLKGSYAFDRHPQGNSKGVYILNASYTDNGGQVNVPLTAREKLVLRSPRIQAVDYDKMGNSERMDIKAGQYPGVKEDISLMVGRHDAYLVFKDIDLTGIGGVEVLAGAISMYFQGGNLAFRIDQREGALIGTLPIETTLAPSNSTLQTSIKATSGKHDLYVIYQAKDKADGQPVCAVVELKFIP